MIPLALLLVAQADGVAFFETSIRPLLIESCYSCHSEQAKKKKGGLHLDTRAGWQAGGDTGPAIVPGDVDKSLLIKGVRYTDDTLEMPPKGKMPPEKIALLEKWVKMGAPDPRTGAPVAEIKPAPPTGPHWAFLPLAKPKHGSIDEFVIEALKAKGLSPSPPAAKDRLVRRVSLDLTGIPPTADEVKAFLAHGALSYDRLVDRLLASPRFGERWARHWLDIARFAESYGFEQDDDRPHAYHYRDFVIRAFNEDLPFDRFVSWQIAGDVLAPRTPVAMAATGFLAAGAFPTQLTEAEFESARYDELDDMVATVGTSFLGLTTGCARCHDHKFDPIAQRDYYRMAATFTRTVRAHVDLDLGKDAHRQSMRIFDAEHALLVVDRDKHKRDDKQWKKADKKVQDHLKEAPGPGRSTVLVATEGRKPVFHRADERGFPHFYPVTYLLRRGDVRQKTDVMEPGVLPVLGAISEGPPRAALAHWLVDEKNGAGRLLARVIVNRLWQHHFGRGLVATPNDFGRQGTPPTHPELLDFLAGELIRGGWRLKPIHRLILTSATYRQSAQPRDDARKADPDNRLWWRWEPRRLEAESIRDAMLAVSGLLDGRMYGPGTLDESDRRRSIYLTVKRSRLVPSMQLFDAPDALTSLGQRSRTTVAPQALLFMNGAQVRRYAEAFAKRLPAQTPEAIKRAYAMTVGRPPTREELADAVGFVEGQAASYGKRSPALVDLCQALLALNEFITIE